MRETRAMAVRGCVADLEGAAAGQGPRLGVGWLNCRDDGRWSVLGTHLAAVALGWIDVPCAVLSLH